MKTLLIIVSGFSCTGKTTLARKIAQEFSIPLISRDDIKESLFNSLGWIDRKWAKKLGIASYDLLYYFTEQLMATRQSLTIESNFQPEFDNHKFLKLKKKYQFSLLQIHCQAETEVILQRFKKRSQSGERHPGHVDQLNYEEIEFNLKKGDYEVLDASDRVIKIDTTDFDEINYETLFKTIQNYL